MLNGRGHRLLAQNVVPLRSKGLDQFRVQAVLDGNNDGICETLPDRPDRLRRSLVELFPGFKSETAIDAISICKKRPGVRTRLGNGYNLAFGGFPDGILCIGLRAEFDQGDQQSVVSSASACCVYTYTTPLPAADDGKCDRLSWIPGPEAHCSMKVAEEQGVFIRRFGLVQEVPVRASILLFWER